MKLSISNIAWSENEDEQVYALMQKYGFTGLEIAPTRIFPSEPYGDLKRVKEWAGKLESEYGFSIPSMQSIWFGRQEKIFGSSKEREILSDYTKKAVDFAAAAGGAFGKINRRIFLVFRRILSIPDGNNTKTISQRV